MVHQLFSLFHMDASYLTEITYYLKVISPLIHAIVLRNLRLEQSHASHEGGQFSDGLTATSTNSHQQSISSRLLQHTADPGQVL